MFIPEFDINKKIPSILTFKTMRRMVGLLGILLPAVILFWSFTFSPCDVLLDSISAYYHTFMRDIFVGILCAVSLFMFSYHGYDLLDFVIFKTAALTCLGIACFPVLITNPENTCYLPVFNQSSFTNIVHYISAALFFGLLAFISLVLFTKTHPETDISLLSAEKKRRNRIYSTCGIIIVACIVLIIAYNAYTIFFDKDFLKNLKPVFWLETAALLSFGISWLVKGEMAFADKNA